MQEICTVIVQTEDGKLLIQEKTTLGFVTLFYPLLLEYNRLQCQSEDFRKLTILHGSGTGQSASDSSLPTAS